MSGLIPGLVLLALGALAAASSIVDVGGTNTDAVLLDGDKVVFAVKCPTTQDVTSGILTQDALVFGGTQLTATDIAVAAGLLDVGDRSRTASISKDMIAAALTDATRQLEEKYRPHENR